MGWSYPRTIAIAATPASSDKAHRWPSTLHTRLLHNPPLLSVKLVREIIARPSLPVFIPESLPKKEPSLHERYSKSPRARFDSVAYRHTPL